MTMTVNRRLSPQEIRPTSPSHSVDPAVPVSARAPVFAHAATARD